MDASDIASKLTATFADPTLHERLREGAVATAKLYGWDRVGAQYIELLKEIDASKRSAVAHPLAQPA
jgi:glycosyltransferase involved in cell wall biosynthesis